MSDMKLIREFTCDLTGVECVIVENHFGEEVCNTKTEYLETLSNVEPDKTQPCKKTAS
jgi:hypothetical protein